MRHADHEGANGQCSRALVSVHSHREAPLGQKLGWGLESAVAHVCSCAKDVRPAQARSLSIRHRLKAPRLRKEGHRLAEGPPTRVHEGYARSLVLY